MKRGIFLLALLCAASVGAAPEWVRGEITKLVPQRATVVIRAEAIKSIGMDAMTMPYKVQSATMLNGYKAGDIVRFTVKMQGDQSLFDSMEHAQ